MRDCLELSRKAGWIGVLLCILSPILGAQPFAGGSGEPNDPYLIATAEQLVAMGSDPNGWDFDYQLVNDIDLSAYVFDQAVVASPYTYGRGFVGRFDGQGYRIDHLLIHTSGGGGSGLFGLLNQEGVIANLEVNDVTIQCNSSYVVGGLVGDNQGLISLSSCRGTIRGAHFVGGLVGTNNGSIQSCMSQCQVSGLDDIGGLAGFNNGDITACRSESQVKGSGTVGGLVGQQGQFGCLFLSVSEGQVAGEYSVGGLVGMVISGGDFTHCYNLSQVFGTDYGIGGLVGLGRFVEIVQCYNAGQVYGPLSVGGLKGDEERWLFCLDSCFWDVEVSGQPDRFESGLGLTTAQMQEIETFEAAGWNFVEDGIDDPNDIWWMPEDGYPRLCWERD